MSDSEQPVSSGAESSGDKPGARGGVRRRGRRGGRGRRKAFPARPGEDAPVGETQDAPASPPIDEAIGPLHAVATSTDEVSQSRKPHDPKLWFVIGKC